MWVLLPLLLSLPGQVTVETTHQPVHIAGTKYIWVKPQAPLRAHVEANRGDRLAVDFARVGKKTGRKLDVVRVEVDRKKRRFKLRAPLVDKHEGRLGTLYTSLPVRHYVRLTPGANTILITPDKKRAPGGVLVRIKVKSAKRKLPQDAPIALAPLRPSADITAPPAPPAAAPEPPPKPPPKRVIIRKKRRAKKPRRKRPAKTVTDDAEPARTPTSTVTAPPSPAADTSPPAGPPPAADPPPAAEPSETPAVASSPAEPSSAKEPAAAPAPTTTPPAAQLPPPTDGGTAAPTPAPAPPNTASTPPRPPPVPAQRPPPPAKPPPPRRPPPVEPPSAQPDAPVRTWPVSFHIAATPGLSVQPFGGLGLVAPTLGARVLVGGNQSFWAYGGIGLAVDGSFSQRTPDRRTLRTFTSKTRLALDVYVLRMRALGVLFAAGAGIDGGLYAGLLTIDDGVAPTQTWLLGPTVRAGPLLGIEAGPGLLTLYLPVEGTWDLTGPGVTAPLAASLSLGYRLEL